MFLKGDERLAGTMAMTMRFGSSTTYFYRETHGHELSLRGTSWLGRAPFGFGNQLQLSLFSVF